MRNGSQLTRMTVGDTVLYFEYDASGTPVAMRVGDEVYHYITNIQGDVLGFYNTDGTKAVSYTYDAWGKPLTSTDTTGTGLAALTPLGRLDIMRIRRRMSSKSVPYTFCYRYLRL